MDEAPVILLTIDSLRRDRAEYLVDAAPRLQQEFAQFRSCFSHGVATPLAFTGIMSGTVATGNGVLTSDVLTPAEASSGTTAGFSNNSHLDAERGYDRGFDAFGSMAPPGGESLLDRLRSIEWIRSNRVAQAVYQRVVKVYRDSNKYEGDSSVPIPYRTAPEVSGFVKDSLADGSPRFVWGHFMDPHSPYHPDTTVGESPDISQSRFRELTDLVHGQNADAVDDSDLEIIRALYDGNVRYCANHLADLLDWCADQTWYDQSLIVVTSDHGELLGEHGGLAHPWDAEPYDELVEVPLFVKFPDGQHAGDSIGMRTNHTACYWTLHQRLSSDSPPEGEYNLSNPAPINTISASNFAVRITTDQGTAVRTKAGRMTSNGDISDAAVERLESQSFPECRMHGGDLFGNSVDPAKKEQLEAMGYL